MRTLDAEQVRNGFIEQLDRFANNQLSSDGLDLTTWLRRTAIEQEQWLARIVLPKL